MCLCQVLFHWFGSLLVGIGRGFRETSLAIVSGFSDPLGQINEPMGKNQLSLSKSDTPNGFLRQVGVWESSQENISKTAIVFAQIISAQIVSDSFPLVPLSAQGGTKIQKLLLKWSPGTPSQYQQTDSQTNGKALDPYSRVILVSGPGSSAQPPLQARRAGRSSAPQALWPWEKKLQPS